LYRSVDSIKIVVKQLTGFHDFTRQHAGSLTRSTKIALKGICDEAAGADSRVCERTDKALGSVYIRTQKGSGHTFKVISSTGKLTNEMLCCMNWMHENAKEITEKSCSCMRRLS